MGKARRKIKLDENLAAGLMMGMGGGGRWGVWWGGGLGISSVFGNGSDWDEELEMPFSPSRRHCCCFASASLPPFVFQECSEVGPLTENHI